MNLNNMHWVSKDLEYKDVVYAIGYYQLNDLGK